MIDPERDIDRYDRIAAEERPEIVAVAETHIHADYLSGVRESAERAEGGSRHISRRRQSDPDWQYAWVDRGPVTRRYPTNFYATAR